MPTDETLYLQLVRGDMDAFDTLYRRYEGRLFGYVLRMLGDHGEAEDVFHEAFMAVLQERRTGRELQSFRGWIFQVARNLCLNRLRSRQRAARALELERREPRESADLEAVLGARELPEALTRAAELLPEQLRELYAMRAAGLSYPEIADALQLPLGTVKSRMHQLLLRLRKDMGPWTAT